LPQTLEYISVEFFSSPERELTPEIELNGCVAAATLSLKCSKYLPLQAGRY
jgi:hypothetical protein